RTIRNLFADSWLRVLSQSNQTDFYHGLALKMAIDQNLIGSGFIEDQFTRHFSDPNPGNILDWLEGLLSEQILWIIYDRSFVSRLNSWIGEMDETNFTNNLPVLRKIFTKSSPHDRQKLFEVIKNPDKEFIYKDTNVIPEEIEDYITELVHQYSY